MSTLIFLLDGPRHAVQAGGQRCPPGRRSERHREQLHPRTQVVEVDVAVEGGARLRRRLEGPHPRSGGSAHDRVDADVGAHVDNAVAGLEIGPYEELLGRFVHPGGGGDAGEGAPWREPQPAGGEHHLDRPPHRPPPSLPAPQPSQRASPATAGHGALAGEQ